MSLTIIHVAEDALAAHVSRVLLDRVVGERAQQPWLRENWAMADVRAGSRQFVDLEQKPGWTKGEDIGRVRERMKPRLRLHPRGVGGHGEWAFVCIKLAALTAPDGDWMVLLSFDTDGAAPDMRCAAGVAEAALPEVRIVIAVAHQEFDSWIVAGFVPGPAHEHQALADEKAQLTAAGHPLDPVTEPHRLTSNVRNDPRDAKKLCQRLLGLNDQADPAHARVNACLDAPLHTLEANGKHAGLAEFIRDVQQVVLPLLGDRS